MNLAAFNTRGGRWGFVAIMEDGRVYREDRNTWDDVPTDVRMAKLLIVALNTGVVHATLTDFAKFFFSNEATERGTMTADRDDVGAMFNVTRGHSAKLFGGIKADGTVCEVRMSFDKPGLPQVTPREYSVDLFSYEPHVLRDGAMAHG